MELEIDDETIAAIKRRLAAAKVLQGTKGVRVDLTDDDILTLWHEVPKKLKAFDTAIRSAIKKGEDVTKVSKYVLTWRSNAAKRTGVINLQTACIANYMESIINCRLKLGDKHTPKSRKKIADARTGTTQSPKTRKSISVAMSGLVRTVEDKQNKSIAATARWAKAREQKAKDGA